MSFLPPLIFQNRCVNLLLQSKSLLNTGMMQHRFENTSLESTSKKKARLLYQSRRRGMLENDLILSTFAHKYLETLSSELTDQYDNLINRASNDWDIYYWVTDKEPLPEEFDNEIMSMLKEHVRNKHCELRVRQPNLPNT